MARRSDVPSIGLVDTNFFVSCFIPTDRFHRDAREYLWSLSVSVSEGETDLYTVPPVLEETLWVACRAYHEAEHGYGSFGALPHGERLNALSEYGALLRGIAEKLLSDRSPYSFAAVLPEDMSVAVHLAAENAVPLTDACLAAVALRLCEGNVITNDRHMGRLPGINCFSYVPPRPDLV